MTPEQRASLQPGDRVKVIASSESLLAYGIPECFVRESVGKTLVVGPACVLARRGADADVPLTLSPESDLEWWFFHNSFLELIPPPTPASTIYATERLRTAQDLLHQLDSIRQQAAILTNKGFSRCELHHALEHVMAGEIESQTTKSK